MELKKKDGAVLIALIFALWLSLTVPLFLYHLGTSSSNVVGDASNNTTCSNPVLYSRSSNAVCSRPLEKISLDRNCPLTSSNLMVIQDKESDISILMLGLKLYYPRSQCIKEALPLLCLYLFGLCGNSDVLIQPTKLECEKLQNSICQQEWNKAKVAGFGHLLPNCSTFPEEQTLCSESGSNSSLVFRNSSDEEMDLLECSPDFYRLNDSELCVPSCYTWSQYSARVAIAKDVLIIFFSLVGFIACVLVIVISSCRHQIMLHYPFVLINYMNLDVLILIIFIMIPYASRKQLFCSSRNLLENVVNVTPYCILSGMVIQYVIFQLSIWWLVYMTSLFYSMKFPFRAQTITKGNKKKLLHALSLAVGLLTPFVPTLASVIGFATDAQEELGNTTLSVLVARPQGYGYGMSGYPPILCTAVDRNIIFYLTVLPMGIILGLGGSLLLASMWLIHKESGKNNNNFGTAEKKLLLVFSYYLIITIVSQITLTLALIQAPKLKAALQEHILCEQNGHKPGSSCDRLDVEHYGNPLITLSSLLAVELLPVVLLVFAVNVQKVKKVVLTKVRSRKLLKTTATNISMDI